MHHNISITYMKAFAILSMVLGHATCGTIIEGIVAQYHMPLFFFVSGYCFKDKHLECVIGYIIRRLNGLWWPFVKYNLIFCLLRIFFIKSTTLQSFDFVSFLKELFLFSYYEPLLGGFWFLKALFWGSIISVFISKSLSLITYLRKYKYILGIVISFIIMIFQCYYLRPFTIFHIDACCFAASVFFLAGKCFSFYKITSFNNFVVLTSFLLLVVGIFCWKTHMAQPFFPIDRVIPYIITAIMIIWSIYSILSNLLTTENVFCKMIRYIGEHTLEILVWHFFSFKIVSYCLYQLLELDVNQLNEFPIIFAYRSSLWWAYFCVGVFFPLFIVYSKERLILYFHDKMMFVKAFLRGVI